MHNTNSDWKHEEKYIYKNYTNQKKCETQSNIISIILTVLDQTLLTLIFEERLLRIISLTWNPSTGPHLSMCGLGDTLLPPSLCLISSCIETTSPSDTRGDTHSPESLQSHAVAGRDQHINSMLQMGMLIGSCLSTHMARFPCVPLRTTLEKHSRHTTHSPVTETPC